MKPCSIDIAFKSLDIENHQSDFETLFKKISTKYFQLSFKKHKIKQYLSVTKIIY